MSEVTHGMAEEAAKAIILRMFAPHELPVDDDVWDEYYSTAVAALKAGILSAWRDIDNAPSDCDLLLGWWESWPERVWRQEVGWAVKSNTCHPKSLASNGHKHGRATHWQPLPGPPKDEE